MKGDYKMGCFGAYHDNYKQEQEEYRRIFKRSKPVINFHASQDIQEFVPEPKKLIPSKRENINRIIIKSFALGVIIILSCLFMGVIN